MEWVHVLLVCRIVWCVSQLQNALSVDKATILLGLPVLSVETVVSLVTKLHTVWIVKRVPICPMAHVWIVHTLVINAIHHSV